jgi:hypothetical protein
MGGHGVAVGSDVDQTFAVDSHTLKEAVILREGREWAKVRPFVGQQLRRRLLRGIGRADGIAILEPRRALVIQVSIIIERPPGQEVALDELDQVFDRPFLVRRGRRTDRRQNLLPYRKSVRIWPRWEWIGW